MPKNLDFTDVKEVAVLGGSIDNTGMTTQSVKICKVIEEGEQDLAVKDDTGYGSKIFIVSKSICVPIRTSKSQLETVILYPAVGDLVFSCQQKDWKNREYQNYIGILWELEYEMGNPAWAHILVDNEIERIKYENVLVLQRREPAKKT